MQSHSTKFIVAAVLSFLGMLITTYLIFQHYSEPDSSFCNISAIINCDAVNKSEYSELFGIPVAILGFGTYLILMVCSLLLRKRYSPKLVAGLTAFAGFGLAFSLYLTIMEFFVLKAVCMFCVAQQMVILILFLLFFDIWMRPQQRMDV